MKTTLSLHRLKPVLVLIFAYGFAFTAAAQNYYPADVSNTWVLEDAEERRTYSLEGPETFEGTEVITLKIEIEELDTGDLIDTDKYFLTVGSENIKLHGTVLEEAAIGGIVTTDFSTPATFFPLNLTLGDKWQIVADATVELSTLSIPGESTTNLEVVAFEDLETPAGTFQNCAKVELALVFSAGGFINVESTTYQWLAPDVGPVQYQNSENQISKLVSFNLLTEPETPDTTEEDMMPEQPTEEDVMSETPAKPSEPSEEEAISETPAEPSEPSEEETMPEPVPYDVTGDGVVNISDLTFVASHFGESDPEADVNDDGIVNILDLVLIARNFSR